MFWYFLVNKWKKNRSDTQALYFMFNTLISYFVLPSELCSVQIHEQSRWVNSTGNFMCLLQITAILGVKVKATQKSVWNVW